MLTVQNVHYAYNRKTSLFDGLDFQLEAGKICGLLGKNGAGKSSLLRLISGAYYSKQGKITFNDSDITKRSVTALQEIYFLQEDYELPKHSIQRYLNIYAPFYPKFDKNIFNNVMEKFEVPIDKKIKDLSFGQKKKFHVAFALATQVKLLIMDEPTNGMDIPSKSVFRSVVSESLQEDQSIIISTHQIRDLGQLLDTIVLIRNGKIILNEDLYSISERFDCSFNPGNQVPDHALYSEPVAGGNMVLTKTDGKIPGEIDIEILFNAIVTNPTILN